MRANIPCEIDVEPMIEKLKAMILTDVRKELKAEIKAHVKEQANEVLKSMDFRDEIREELKKASRNQITECLQRVRKDEYEKFYLSNGKQVDPSPEKLYNILASYIGYVELFNDKRFKTAVKKKAVDELVEQINSELQKRRVYSKMYKLMDEEENDG